MPEIWFISGPPLGVALWRAVADRVRSMGINAKTWACLASGSGDIAEEFARLSADLDGAEGEVFLVGHGSALPLVRAAGAHPKVSGLVLSNGPGQRLDRLSRLWSRLFSMPKPLRDGLLGPTLIMPLLQSSLGMRRVVVNPYVMDRDTVVAICGPFFSDAARLQRTASYFKSLADLPETPLDLAKPILLCWGDSDPLGADTYSDFLMTTGPKISHSPIPGGRFMHPVERPWELADRVTEWSKKWSTTT